MEAPLRILIVDDDERLLALLQTLMEDHSDGRWRVGIASETAAALAMLQSEPVDLVVLDVHMPLVDGVQFLRLLDGKFPDMAKVVLTGDATGAHRQACLDAGADLFLEKPRVLGGWEAVFATLDQLAHLRANDSGFRGMLRQVELQDVLQMECLARSSSVLTIKAGAVEGRIYIKEGSFVHAEVGDSVGEDAFNKLLALSRGEFGLHPYAEPTRQTINGPWEFLLMEAARRRDELAGTAVAEPALHLPDSAVVMDHPAPEEGLPASIVKLPTWTANQEPPNGNLRPRIEEVLLSSPRADVLHEWQSSCPEQRMRLMAMLQHKANQLGEGLPLGSVDGLDIEGGASRILIQLRPDYLLFVRSRVCADGPQFPSIHEGPP